MFSGFNLVFEIFGFCLKSCNENSTKRCIKILWCRFVSSTSLRCYFTDEGKIFCLCYVNITYENEKKNPNSISYNIVCFLWPQEYAVKILVCLCYIRYRMNPYFIKTCPCVIYKVHMVHWRLFLTLRVRESGLYKLSTLVTTGFPNSSYLTID